jgi:hypothetical protein
MLGRFANVVYWTSVGLAAVICLGAVAWLISDSFSWKSSFAAYQAIPNHWSKIDTSVFALSPGASPWSFEQPPAYDWRTTLGTCLVVIPAVLVYASGWAFRYVVAGATGHPRPARTVPSQRSTVSVRPERQEPPKLIL